MNVEHEKVKIKYVFIITVTEIINSVYYKILLESTQNKEFLCL
jgi:hypothetical protein